MYRKLIYLICFVFVVGLALTNTAIAQDPDLVGHWKLDDGSGTIAVDSSGNGNDGTLQGDPQWVTGQIDGALEFDGNGDYVDCGNNAIFNITEEITLAVWVNANDLNNGEHNCWLGKGDNAYAIKHQSGNNLEFFIYDGDWHSTNYTTNIESLNGEWHHMAGTYDGNALKFYLDGVLSVTTTYASSIGTATHNVYLGENSQATGRYFDGMLDDARIYSRALTAEEIVDVLQGVSITATKPDPENEAADVPRDIVLSWTPGKDIQTHDVYFGTAFADVNEATRTNPLNVLVSQAQNVNTYDPDGLLEYDRIYYWRIDEIEAGGSTIHKGNIWSFTAERFAYPIPGQSITVTASSYEENKEPENVVNGSGLDETGLLHGRVGDGTMWLSNRDGEQPTWIEFEFDKAYPLYELWVWNSNESLESVIGLGIREVTIEYSIDGIDYTTLGTTYELPQAPGAENYAHNTTIELSGITAKFVRFTANSNWGGLLDQYGLSEVRFFFLPVHAKEPDPASGAINIDLESTLNWRAGRGAAEHNVYFSDDMLAVIDGTSGATTVTDTSYGPLSLDLSKTYYWRIDEVNGTQLWQGDLWSFKTIDYFIVDDFEDYNDYEPDRIFDAWADGWNSTTNGSTIGYPNPDFAAGEHFAETTAVHSGAQAMPYFYDNSAGNSEATMMLDSRRNWTEKGVNNLSLWFMGNPDDFVEDPAGTYTISASGADIWGTADEFRFVYKLLSGPGSITAKVESIEDTHEWAKAGVMIRQSLEPDSKFAAVYITPGQGCRFQGRLTLAGEATSDSDIATTEQTAITAPYWVRIDRDASNNFNGYYSSDGINWTPMAWNPQNTAMSQDVYIGLAVTSHNSSATCTAVLSDVQTTGTVSPQLWSQQAIGVEMPSNDSELMYVVLNDSAVVYNDSPDATQTDEWRQWDIDLQRFADQGIDLTNVETIGIGFGDRDNPQLGGLGVVYFDDIRLYPSPPQEPALITVENASFEEPGTEKQTGFDNVSGWNTDEPCANSGVEMDYTPTDGDWTVYLMSGDPSIWQLTDYVIAEGDILELKVDARITWAATNLQMTIYYDDNGTRVPAATSEVTLAEDMQEYILLLSADVVPASIGHQVGIEFVNSTSGESWIGLDNVRLGLAQ
ncbi:MAG: hypothetical protein PVH77_07390 [Phycisphaerales bacterium]|jgi:hypothetical protein